jgi:hypothetical protein
MAEKYRVYQSSLGWTYHLGDDRNLFADQGAMDKQDPFSPASSSAVSWPIAFSE